MSEIPGAEPAAQSGWWIALKVAAFVAVPVALIYLLKLLLGS